MAIRASSTDWGGFSADMTASEARRQLRLSLGVVAMLGVAIVSAGVSVGAHPLSAKRYGAALSPTMALRIVGAIARTRAI